MKIIVIGDVHGLLEWNEIVDKEIFDKVIFLGDYVDTHYDISAEQQLSNLEDILNYKESNSDKVILLRGNHDLSELGFPWARCSGFNPKVCSGLTDLGKRYEQLTQWIYIQDNIIFSHAGVSQDWMDYNAIKSIDDINKYPLNSEEFGFTPKGFDDVYGTSPIQPPVWIRPITLSCCAVKGYTQVVGHTPVTKRIFNIKEQFPESENIWLCDAMNINQYLVIDNDKFICSSI